MTQQEKQLLTIEICTRLPYGVTVKCLIDDEDFIEEEGSEFDICGYDGIDFINENALELRVDVIRPYLRSLSSMTEEERKYYNALVQSVRDGETYEYEVVDWLNENDFDYRGLIEKDLAFEMPKSMYKTK